MNKNSSSVFYLKSIEINSFRLFGDLNVNNIHPNLTVFIAPNSGGKTTILDAIALMLRSFICKQAPDIRSIDMHEASKEPTKVKLQLIVQENFPNSGNPFDRENYLILSNLREGNQFYSSSIVSPNFFGNKLALEMSQWLEEDSFNHDTNTLPLFAYFTADRRIHHLSQLDTSEDYRELLRQQAYRGLLPCNHLQNFDQWLRERAITGLEKRLEMEEIGEQGVPTPDAHLKAVSNVLALMLEKEVGIKTVKYFASTKSIQAVTETGKRDDINQLSHGAKSVLTIAAQLAMHCCALNPHLKDQAPTKTPGIILIDEIDLHLHPKWQHHVIDDLRRCFPIMQFIVSTHSPAVLSTVKKENIREIKVDYETGDSTATEPLSRSYGESIADTLETIMDVSARPDNDLVREIHQYLNWAENGELTEDQSKQRALLEDELGEDHADLLTADLILQRRKILAGKE